MTDTSRNRLQNDARREQLLELGVRLFSARPYDEVSIDDIAREAGISKGLLYHYFGGKRAFYVAVVREAASRLELATRPDPALPPRDRAMSGLNAYLDFVEARAEAFVALMEGGLGADPEIAAVIEGARAGIERGFMEGIDLTTPHPVFRTAIRAWIGAVERASLDWLHHRDVDRDTLLLILLASLASHLAVASQLDPDAGVDLEELRALGAALGVGLGS